MGVTILFLGLLLMDAFRIVIRGYGVIGSDPYSIAISTMILILFTLFIVISPFEPILKKRQKRLIDKYTKFVLQKDKMSKNEIYLVAKKIRKSSNWHNFTVRFITIKECAVIDDGMLLELDAIIKEIKDN